MVVKTYFDKNNTIILNSFTNTGRNPVTELYYGGEGTNNQYTRFLCFFDLNRLKSYYTGDTFPDITKLTHRLKMTNTGSLDKALLGQDTNTCINKERSTSFDLILFPITQFWEEGIGYDYEDCAYVAGQTALNVTPASWFSASTLSAWTQAGTYTGATSGITIATQHFSLGNENLDMNITNYVNGILTGNTNNGLVLAYQQAYERLETDAYQYVGFFTRHTQSIYEPYVESIYSEHITDDRHDFYLDKQNELYLYVNLGGTPTNLDTMPSVVVTDSEGDVFSAYTPSAVTHVTKGVYSINIIVPTNNNNTPNLMFNDTWSGITINGINRPSIMLDFALKDSLSWYNIGDNSYLPKKVGIVASGIQRGERVKRGDIRKVIIQTKIPYTVNQEQKVDNVEYRLYVKEGRNDLTIIDYQPVEMANNHNYFLLDTLSFLPNTYYVDIKVTSNLEVSTLAEVLYFDITSLSELRYSQ